MPKKPSALAEIRQPKLGNETPSQLPFPVFCMCPPVYVSNAVQNNPTMREFNGKEIDKEKFMSQWYSFYNVLAANSLVYLITPVKGLGDQTYVNSFMYLPHTENVIVLSNFTAEGRPGEETVAGALFKGLGYTVVECPYKFEGEPELKHLRDNIYLGGYGFRSDPRAHEWIAEQYDAQIILIEETDEILYHLDCSVFPIGEYNTLVCTEIMDPQTVSEIEKVTNIIPVSAEDAHQGICNSLRVEDCIYNSSALEQMKKTDEDYMAQRHKNDTLEAICSKLGQELLYFNLSESELSGAKLSCFVGTLTGPQART